MEENALETTNNFNNADRSCSTVAFTAPSISDDQEEEGILELHVDYERAVFKKFNLPKHDFRVETKCDSYKRNSTQESDVLKSKFKPHKIQQSMGTDCGALDRIRIFSAEQTKEFMLCYYCNECYSITSDSQHEWSNLWPSFIFTAMKSINPKL